MKGVEAGREGPARSKEDRKLWLDDTKEVLKKKKKKR